MNKVKKILCNNLASSEIVPWKIRRLIYSSIKLEIGENSEIRPNCFFNSEYVKIGNGSFINYNTQFHSGYNTNAQIILNNNVFVRNECSILYDIS